MLSTVEHMQLTIAGLHIHCLAAGETGPPVILLHGGGIDSAMLSWEEIIGPLSRNHRVFAPDLPGYGQSDKPARAYTMSYYITFLEQLMDALQLERPSLVGLSLGGGIALGLTLHAPKRVEKLILVDTYGIQDRVSAHFLSYLFVQLPYLDEMTYWLLSRSRSIIRWTLLAGLIYSPQHLSGELVNEVYQASCAPHAGKAFISTQRSDVLWNGLRTNFTGRLHEIHMPTLIIHGAQDTAVPLSYALRAHKFITSSELYVMSECRHWPQREKPQEFLRAVSKFLDT